MIIALLAMGIVLIYRSSRVINFAVGDLGVPVAALLAFMVGKSGWPYWPSLIFAVAAGTVSGTVVELVVIRRLFKAPRVIVLVATIGVAELARRSRRPCAPRLPHRPAPDDVSRARSPASWELGSVTVKGSQLLVLIVVPLITIGLWWLLGHTRFGESVRGVGDERRPRPAHRHQPEDDVDRDLDDRRLPLGGRGHPLRDRSRARPSS